MTGWIIAGVVVAIIVLWYIGTMNKFRRLKIAIEESWAGIDVQLKRKANIIPNLVDALKMQMNFEEKVLTELTAARTGLTSSDRGEAMAASDKISALIPTIRATAENYPQLGTNNSFLQLMSDIRDCEDKITYARNRYNMTTARYNMEIVMIPFAIKQQKNSIKQAKLRPKEMAIRKKYAGRNDQATQQKVTQEIQELYQKENYSPFSGCLPLLIQLPIMIALYQVVIDPAFYVLGQAKQFSTAMMQYFTTSQAAGGFGGVLNSDRGTIEILSKLRVNGIEAFEGLKSFGYFSNSGALYDALHGIEEAGGIPSVNIGSWNFGLTPWSAVTTGGGFFASHWWLLLVPVLTFVVYFASMKINRKLSYQPTTAENDKATGCSNNMMNIMMPAMSAWFTFMVPAAVGLYWMFKSVLTTIKQLIMKKVMPLPTFTEEDYKAAEKEMYGKHPQKAPKASSTGGTRNPNVRSLHHIDDDEYDSKGNYIGRPEASEAEETKTEKKNQKAPAMAEPLKDESDKHAKDDASDDKNS